MALTLISEPIHPINTVVDYSTFNSVNRRIEFKFQRKDYVKTSEFTIVNTGGYVGLDLVTTTPTNATAGDIVYFSSGSSLLYATGFYEVLSVDTVNNKIVIDLPYSSTGHADDYINVNADRANYYVELRMAVNGSYYSQKASADSTGLITIDVSGTLRRLFDLKDDFDYFTNYQGLPLFANDTNQIKLFNVRYYEKYSTSTDGGINISRDYYAINSTPDIDDSSNSYKVYFANRVQDYMTRWMTMFKNPVVFGRYPSDMQIIAETGGTTPKQMAVYYWDKNKYPLFTDFGNQVSNAYATGIKRINTPFHKILDYFNGKSEGWLVYTIFNFNVGHSTEQLYMKYDNQCRNNPIYVKWLNKLGGWSYWLFSSSVEYGLDKQSGGVAMARVANEQNNNQREFTIPGVISDTLKLYDNELEFDEREAWQDFMYNDNVFVLKNKFHGTMTEILYSKPSTLYELTIRCSEEHNLKVGDYVQFFGTSTSVSLYAYKYIVLRTESRTVFTIQSLWIVYQTLPLNAIWSKVIDANDWTLCRKENQTSTINSANSNFSLSFDLVKPSLTRRLK